MGLKYKKPIIISIFDAKNDQDGVIVKFNKPSNFYITYNFASSFYLEKTGAKMINSACNWGNYIITGALGLSHWLSSKVKALYIHYSLHTVLSNILLLVR